MKRSLAFLLTSLLLVFSLVARAQLSQISLQVVEQQTALEELATQKQKLLVQYEFAFNLAEIEDYAMRELGMQQPRSEQIYYISSGVADKAEILTPESKENGLQKVFSTISLLMTRKKRKHSLLLLNRLLKQRITTLSAMLNTKM